jgi:hypothetical protein
MCTCTHRTTTAAPQVHLREDADIGDELTGILLPHEVEAVRAADSHLHFILQALSYIVESAHLSNLREERLFQHIMAFNDEIGEQGGLLDGGWMAGWLDACGKCCSCSWWLHQGLH